MKTLIALILLAQTALADTVHYETIGNRQRRYVVHLPPQAKAPLPVVLNLHGGMSRAETQVRQSQMNAVADKHGFIVVYPDGTGPATALTFNAGTCCGYAVTHRVNDVAFIDRLIAGVQSQFKGDAKRIYVCGFSNGAMMAYRCAAELSTKIAAVASVSGDLGVNGPAPVRPIPVIHFHGLLDQNAPFNGGVGTNQFQPVPHRSIPETIGIWCRWNKAVLVKTIPGADVTEYRYAGGADVRLYVLPNGGHTWPGGIDVSPRLNTGPLVRTVNASELIWEFFSAHPLP